jgi:uncharacterized protein (DUF1800 family)
MKQINRSEFLSAISGADNVSTKTAPKNPFANQAAPQNLYRAQTGITEYTGQFTSVELSHLLRRTLFGVTPADLAYFDGLTLDQVVAALLTPAPTPAPPINAYNTPSSTDPNVPAGTTWVNAAFESGSIDNQRILNLKQWWCGLMINQNRSLTEKMTLFWHNHFATQMYVVKDSRYSYKHVALLRANALGNFKTLARLVTTDPQMLVYLNGDTNTLNNPNENYGREFQELFTVGAAPYSAYTQSDVEAAAALLTGWTDNPLTISSAFNPADHDTSNKQFSAFYNNTLIEGQSGAAGDGELDQFVDMVFSQAETAKFLCRNLYRWFIYYDIDDQVESDVITPLANIVIQNNFDMVPVLSALLKSEHFFDPANIGCLIKNPADYLIGVLRQFNVAFPKKSDYTDLYAAWGIVWSGLVLEAMEPGDPPNVAGWPAYYQAPEFHEIWINSDTLPLRNEITDGLGSLTGIVNGNVTLQIDFTAFALQLSNPGDPDQLIADSLALLSANAFDAGRIALMKSVLLSGQLSDYYWTDAWTQFTGDPTNNVNKNTVQSRLRSVYSYIMEQSEFQLI